MSLDIDTWLDVAVEEGRLRPIDRAFARFLATLDASAGPRVLAAAALASRELGDGHICIDVEALGQMEPWLVDATDWLTGSPLVAGPAGDPAAPLVLDGGLLYLRRFWRDEVRVAEAIVGRLAPADTPVELKDELSRLFPGDGGTPDWQKIACAVAARGTFTVITGGPGTGKTTTVVGVIACLVEMQPTLRIALAAPTGKAAQRMQEALHARASGLPPELAARLPQTSYTLHRLLGWLPGGRFRHHRDNPLPYELVVVDEASMIDVALAAHLLDALAPGARLVLLGDKDQLAAVEAGAVFAELSARPAFSAAGCRRIAQALGVQVADFVAALPSETGGPPVLAGAASDAVTPPARPASTTTRATARGKRKARDETDPSPAQACLFDFDEAPIVEPVALPAVSIDGFAGAPLDAWIEPEELGWLDAWRIDEQDVGGAAMNRETRTWVPGTGLEPAPPVGAISPLADCVVWLERNYRFGLDSPIGRLSLAIRRGAAQDALDALSTEAGAAARYYDDSGDALSVATIERLAHGFDAYGEALRAALATAEPDPLPLFDALNRFRILCATRSGARGADEVNQRVAAQVRRAVRVPLAVGAHWFAGRPVMVTRNDYALGLFNGDIGIALPDARGALRVWFRGADGQARAVSPAALPPHDTAFALTVHKSQGSEFDEAALVLPAVFGRVLSRELVYTAITRARSRVQVIGPRTVLAQAIATRTQRDSGLAARIAEAAARRAGAGKTVDQENGT